MNKIWVNTIVKNEERYLWFTLMSVADFVDTILVWDTGSTDNTLKVIEELKKRLGEKIYFKEVGEVDPAEYPKVRQKMLDDTKSDWFLIVDGDEIWWRNSVKKIADTIKNKGSALDSIISPYYNIVGDIYHYQEKEAGKYRIDEREGHINIRAINRKIPGLHFDRPHGQLGIFDKDGVLLQDRPKNRRVFLNAPYMHFTNVIRSSNKSEDNKVPKRSMKLKYELGTAFPQDFKFPEVFYQPYPDFIPSPFKKMSRSFFIKAAILSVPRKIKRRIFKSKSGY